MAVLSSGVPISKKKRGISKGAESEEKWPGFDFNTIVELCYCCGQEALKSGSRWSVWFCEECKEKVVNFNTMFQETIIPIGRHSLMAGYGLGGRDIRSQEKIEGSVSDVKGLFARFETLDNWRKIVVVENYGVLGYFGDVLLSDYLKDVGAKLNKSKAFDGLLNFFQRRVKD